MLWLADLGIAVSSPDGLTPVMKVRLPGVGMIEGGDDGKKTRLEDHRLVGPKSRKATRLVIDKYGEPDEATDSQLTWHKRAAWKRIVATKALYQHDSPAPHHDSIETVINCRLPPDKFSTLAAFDGRVIVERTASEVSVRCHDEKANSLALNLMHDTVTGAKSIEEARAYYAKEFEDYRRAKPTPYMEKLRFTPGDHSARRTRCPAAVGRGT